MGRPQLDRAREVFERSGARGEYLRGLLGVALAIHDLLDERLPAPKAEPFEEQPAAKRKPRRRRKVA
jgi:hypothetical protein